MQERVASSMRLNRSTYVTPGFDAARRCRSLAFDWSSLRPPACPHRLALLSPLADSVSGSSSYRDGSGRRKVDEGWLDTAARPGWPGFPRAPRRRQARSGAPSTRQGRSPRPRGSAGRARAGSRRARRATRRPAVMTRIPGNKLRAAVEVRLVVIRFEDGDRLSAGQPTGGPRAPEPAWPRFMGDDGERLSAAGALHEYRRRGASDMAPRRAVKRYVAPR